MKKILLTAIVAMFGMSAFAQSFPPADGTEGYFYNEATKKFLTDAPGVDATGAKIRLTIEGETVGQFDGSGQVYKAEGHTYRYMRFSVSGTNNYLKLQASGLAFPDKSQGYNKWAVENTEKGWLVRMIYVSANSGNENFAQGSYLAIADGALTLIEEPTDGAYWTFLSPEEYAALTGTEPEPEPEPAVFPEEGAKGFLYNIDSKLFISKADDNTATLAAKPNAADELMVVRLAKDKDNTPSIEGAMFMRFGFGSSSNLLNFNGASGLICNGSSYGQWIVKETEKGILLTHPYPNSSGPAWMKTDDATIEAYTGSYLAVVDGALAFVKFDGEPTANAYWKFGSEEDITTRISSVENVATTKAIFNIAGQQIKSLQKGLNIVNGKKIYVK